MPDIQAYCQMSKTLLQLGNCLLQERGGISFALTRLTKSCPGRTDSRY
jgi:hypothetical protein